MGLQRTLCALGLAALLGGAALGLAGPAHAAAYDPDLEWRTLTTPHFNITFHQGEEQLAEELSAIAERVHVILTRDMDHTPRRRTEVVLVDHTDIANGYAMSLPVNTIVIFVTAPQEQSGLDLYEEWLEAIFTHEYAHILHLDTVEGLPRALRMVMGRIISVNHLSPWWVIEGQATYMETRHTTGGRGRNPHTDMILRMSILEDAFPKLGALDGFMSGPPGGHTRYLFGQSFLKYIADHTSDDAMTRWNHSYGGWVLPYLLPARQVFGASFHQLYEDWKAALEVEYAVVREAVIAQGLTTPQIITDLDGSCEGPSFSPKGDKLVFSCTDRRTGPAILLADGQGGDAEVELERSSAARFAWRPDGEAFAYAASHVVNDFNLYEDVYFHTLGTDSATRLTSGKRARDPAFSPDGGQLLVVRNEVQNNNLAILRIDQSLEALTDYSDHTQLSSPVWSPDGRFLALSVWQDGNRDIWVYTADGQPYRRVTMDPYTDRDPAFSADGRWLFFSSDRTGIPNIYAVELEAERLFQVTNVLGGAFEPTVRADFQVMAWQHYTANGFKIALHPVEPETWWDRGQLPLPLAARGSLAAVVPGGAPTEPEVATWHPRGGDAGFGPAGGGGASPAGAGFADQPTRGAEVDDVTEVDLETAEEQDYPFSHPVGPYKALPTLFPPRYVVPSIYNTTFGLMGALSTSGTDTLRRYLWSANVNYRTDARYVGGGASFTWNRWRPIFSWGANTYVVPYADIYVVPDTKPGANIPTPHSSGERYWDQRFRVWTTATYSRRQRTFLYARYNGLVRIPKGGLGDDVYRNTLPTRGFLSTVEAGWRYSNGQAYSYSISPEDARYISIAAQWTSPFLGSFVLDNDDQRVPFNQLQLNGEIREYVTNPWVPNHVLALRAAGGVSFGDNLRYGSFRLGGNWGESPYLALPDEWRPLRGFPSAASSGDGYYLGSIEYRFPIWRIDWGPGALPFFARTLHGAVFTDFGDTFNSVDQIGVPLVGAGGELRMSFLAGWALGLNARAGYAVGLLGGGYGPTDVGAWYFRLGTSF
ncbi:MAG: PD40 domain-containing protein [Alphaproteobacteria bacterium]|nr:PD40 domain-containing protein [Alphaproteobacteria bacterium]